MNKQQITKFNELFSNATERMKNIVSLGDYAPTSIGFFDKLKLYKSIRNLEKCLTMVPDHFASIFFIGKAYQRLGKHKIALKFFEKASELEPDNYNTPQEASLECIHLDNIDKAVEYSKEAVRRQPNDAPLLGNLAMNLLIAGQDEEAIQTIDKAMAIDPNDQINKNVKKRIEDTIKGIKQRPTCKTVF